MTNPTPTEREALPELPECYDGLLPNADDLGKGILDGYTADQMRAYARAALASNPSPAAAQVSDKVDAERYRWLRAQDNEDFTFAVVMNPHFDVYGSGEELDAAIDTARAKEQP